MVERGGLENRCAFTGTEGSNPSLSAILSLAANCVAIVSAGAAGVQSRP